MKNDKKVVINIVGLALVCSALPMLTIFIMGSGGQNGMLWDQVPQGLNQAVIFVSMTLAKLTTGTLFIPIIGLGLSLYYQRQNPPKFRLMSISFALFLAGTLLFSMFTTWLEINYAQQALSAGQRTLGYSSMSCISSVVNIISWAILLFAIFSPKFNTDIAHPNTKGDL